MKGLISDITTQAKSNTFFRQVLETGEHTQVVIMSIPPSGEIGEEVHKDNDQILFCVEGVGKVILEGEGAEFKQNDLVLVRAGTKHNFINTSSTDLKIITSYSPPHHPEGTIHKTKQEADQAKY